MERKDLEQANILNQEIIALESITSFLGYLEDDEDSDAVKAVYSVTIKARYSAANHKEITLSELSAGVDIRKNVLPVIRDEAARLLEVKNNQLKEI